MRTTLTLDDDVALRLQDEMQRSGTSFRQAVNGYLRRGLDAPGPGQATLEFRVEARDLGLRPGIRLDDVAGLIDALDGPVSS
jgi:hypothetical protein